MPGLKLACPPFCLSSKCFLQNLDERTITRQEDTVQIVLLVKVLRGDIESDQSLPSPWNSGHKAGGLVGFLASVCDDVFYGLSRAM